MLCTGQQDIKVAFIQLRLNTGTFRGPAAAIAPEASKGASANAAVAAIMTAANTSVLVLIDII